MLIHASRFPEQWRLELALLLTAGMLGLAYRHQRRLRASECYQPKLAWLRAAIYFCGCLLVASGSGVLGTVLSSPLATEAQRADPRWWGFTVLCFAVIVVGYALIWPMGTFTDGRKRHALLSLAYGAVWGFCQALWFLSLWALVERSGLNVWAVAALSYLLIGGYNGVWHRYYWDIQVSPPHNYREWNGRKVLFCHTPNLLVCLSYLALFGNAGLFVLLQGIALAASAYAMRFPAWWDAYSAEPGQERSLT